MRTVTSALALVAGPSAFSGTAFAQALTFEVEGPIRNVEPSGSGYIVEVMGAKINVPAGLAVSTPTALASISLK